MGSFLQSAHDLISDLHRTVRNQSIESAEIINLWAWCRSNTLTTTTKLTWEHSCHIFPCPFGLGIVAILFFEKQLLPSTCRLSFWLCWLASRLWKSLFFHSPALWLMGVWRPLFSWQSVYSLTYLSSPSILFVYTANISLLHNKALTTCLYSSPLLENTRHEHGHSIKS